MKLKLLITILCLVPVVGFCQLKKVAFDVTGFHIVVNREDISTAMKEFLHLPEGFSFIQKSIINIENEQHYNYNIFYKGYQVEGGIMKLHYRNGVLYYINGEYSTNIPIIDNPRVSEEQAFIRGLDYTKAEKYLWDDLNQEQDSNSIRNDMTTYPNHHSKLVLYTYSSSQSIALCHRVQIYAVSPLSHKYLYVNCETGEIVGERSLICSSTTGSADTRYSGTQIICTKQITANEYHLEDKDCSRGNGIVTLNMNNQTDIANSSDFVDHDNAWTNTEFHNSKFDDAALDAHWGAEITYDYFKSQHGRNGIDGSGFLIKNFVHRISGWTNAAWDGMQMLYGDGNGSVYGPFTALDIAGHEIGHGFCQNSANLVYEKESGAINEGLSDIWGTCIEFYGRPNRANWTIGEDIYVTSGIHSQLRSMSNPKLENQPDTYLKTNWYATISCNPTNANDYCGVHTNSGVINFWFFLLSNGGVGTNDKGDMYNVASIGIGNAAKIVYKAETAYLTSTTDYPLMRKFTIQAAQDIFGLCSPQVKSTINAWQAVGVGPSIYGIENVHINTLNISVDITNTTPDNEYALGYVIATNKISSISTAKYEATGAVIMNPGFEASKGSVFLAQIKNCNVDLSVFNKRSISEETVIRTDDSESTLSSSNSNFEIYPNPSFDKLYIINHNITSAHYEILSLEGRVLGYYTPTETNMAIDIGYLSSDMYFIRQFSSGTVETKKFIKQIQ